MASIVSLCWLAPARRTKYPMATISITRTLNKRFKYLGFVKRSQPIIPRARRPVYTYKERGPGASPRADSRRSQLFDTRRCTRQRNRPDRRGRQAAVQRPAPIRLRLNSSPTLRKSVVMSEPLPLPRCHPNRPASLFDVSRRTRPLRSANTALRIFAAAAFAPLTRSLAPQ